jgi:hypothetical protein
VGAARCPARSRAGLAQRALPSSRAAAAGALSSSPPARPPAGAPGSDGANLLVNGPGVYAVPSYLTTHFTGPRELLSPGGDYQLLINLDGSVQLLSMLEDPPAELWSPGVLPPAATPPLYFGVMSSGKVGLGLGGAAAAGACWRRCPSR